MNHELHSSKQHTFIIAVSMGQESWKGLTESATQGLTAGSQGVIRGVDLI